MGILCGKNSLSDTKGHRKPRKQSRDEAGQDEVGIPENDGLSADEDTGGQDLSRIVEDGARHAGHEETALGNVGF